MSAAVHQECGHPVEYLSVASYGGYEHLPMRCLECFAERPGKGLCEDCGAPGKQRPRFASEAFGAGDPNPRGDFVGRYCLWPPPRLCDSCYRRWLTPDRCEICGRFGAVSYVEAGTEPSFYDPYWGPQPPEPYGAVTCGRLACRNRLLSRAHARRICGAACPWCARRPDAAPSRRPEEQP